MDLVLILYLIYHCICKIIINLVYLITHPQHRLEGIFQGCFNYT